MNFLGEIGHKWIKSIMQHDHPLVFYVVKAILGDEFLTTDHKYRVNIDISFMFLAISLELSISKEKERLLCERLFNDQV